LMSEDTEKGRVATLGKIAEIVRTCPNFFDWERCEEICDFFKFCSDIDDIYNIENLDPKGLLNGIKEKIESWRKKSSE